jgi:hypothetical protein
MKLQAAKKSSYLGTKALPKEQKQVVEDEQEVVEKPATLASCAGALHEILTTQLADEKPRKVAPGVL